MTDNVTNELILKNIQALRSDVKAVQSEMSEMRGEVRSMKSHIMGLVQSDLTRDSESASIKSRLDRIEKRLELSD